MYHGGKSLNIILIALTVFSVLTATNMKCDVCVCMSEVLFPLYSHTLPYWKTDAMLWDEAEIII